MATLPITIGAADDAKGFIGQKYFYGPVTLTNTGNTDLTNLSIVIDKMDDTAEGTREPGKSEDYFDIFYIPTGFTLKANETRVFPIVYIPKKVSTPNLDNAFWWFAKVHVEDGQGNKSRTDASHSPFVMPDNNQDVKQTFVDKWKPDQTKDAFIYSYHIDLITETGVGSRVYDWYLFLDLPAGAYISPEWLASTKGWLALTDISTPVSNTVLATQGDGSHTLDPGSTLPLDIQIVYPNASTEYETLNNLALNYVFN